MEDSQIITLFQNRQESAITETSNKYGNYCNTIANNILSNTEDTEECVNDTYLKLWNTIPPTIPKIFSAFIATITRNLALQMYRYKHRKKRGMGEIDLIIDELENCISSKITVESTFENQQITEALNAFLSTMNKECRIIFLQRYWFANSISNIASKYEMSESKVKSLIFRQRKKLAEYLYKEGIEI